MPNEFTDLIDTMDQRLAVMQADIDERLDAHQTLTRARNLLADLDGEAKASHWPTFIKAATKTVTAVTAATPAFAAALTPKTAKATPPTSGTVPCPDCGKPCKPGNGLGVHRARAHKAAPFTTEPITKGGFDEQKARDAVAGPPTGRVLPMHNGRPAGSAPAAPPAPAARPAFTVEQAHEALA